MAYKPKILTASEGGTGASNTATSGKMLIGNGTNFVTSTPAFPNASATSGKVIKSDGTDWTASTETFATPSTSGNVMTSNGTNWTSAAPSGGGGYSINATGGTTGLSPVDSTTYYMVCPVGFTTTHPMAATRIYIPATGTITKVYGVLDVSTTLGSTENSTIYIRLNDTTDTAISTTLNLSATPVTFTNTSMSVSVTAGDYIEIKWITPAWVTNPTNVHITITVLIT